MVKKKNKVTVSVGLSKWTECHTLKVSFLIFSGVLESLHLNAFWKERQKTREQFLWTQLFFCPAFSIISHGLEIHLKATETFIQDTEVSPSYLQCFSHSGSMSLSPATNTDHLKAVFSTIFMWGFQSKKIRLQLLATNGNVDCYFMCYTVTVYRFRAISRSNHTTLGCLFFSLTCSPIELVLDSLHLTVQQMLAVK